MKKVQMNLEVPEDVKDWIYSEAGKDDRKPWYFLTKLIRPMMAIEMPADYEHHDNRLVSVDGSGNIKVEPVDIYKDGDAHLQQSIMLKVDNKTVRSLVEQVFDHWRLVMGKNESAKLTDKRKKAITGRLKEGYTVNDLKQAITGCSLTPHNMGSGPTNPDGKLFNCLELICRSGENVERFIGNQQSVAPQVQRYSKTTQQNVINAQGFINGE